MLSIQTTNLSGDQRQRVHADFLANEQTYLQMREELLRQYAGLWVAIHDGAVVAAERSLMTVTDVTAQIGGHPYIALVGAEDQTIFRVRRAIFPYDHIYQPFALPRLTVTFWNDRETHSLTCTDVIPDTGADVSILPDTDCQAIDLYNSPYFTGLSGGVIGPSMTTLFYRGKGEIDGHRFSAFIQPIPHGSEHIIGRDILNQMRLLFDGPAGQLIVNP